MRWSSGDYQIAPIAARSTAMGRWRLTPPWYWGDTACGRDRRRKAPHPSASLTPVSLRVGRFADLTRHRRVIQYRGPLKGKANGGTPFNAADLQGEGLGDKKKRPGALLLALFISFCLFISFWWRRSGRSETGATGRRRGLRRGRRSWGPRWAAPRAGRSSSRRFGVFPPTWPADAGDASPAY